VYLIIVVKMGLRKIIIGENVFLYSKQAGVNPATKEGLIVIKIFLSGFKQTPLLINFLTWDDPMIGYPLNAGFPILNTLTGEKEIINLNRPKYIKECILYGQKAGWTGDNKLEPLDGLKMFSDFGYDISVLIPKDK